MPTSPDDIGRADTVDGFCKFCLVDRINAGLPPAKNDPYFASLGIPLCENLCFYRPPADFEHEDRDKTPQQSLLEREARLVLDQRLARKPLACRRCGGPLDFVHGQVVCIFARLGRCPPQETHR